MKTRSFSPGDFLVVLSCGMIIASLCALKLQTQRSLARASQCSNHLKQIGLAFHNYHAAYKQLPAGSGGTDRGSEAKPLLGNASRLSGLVGLTPFIEEQRVWEMVSNPYQNEGTVYPPMGPVPWYSAEKYVPWSMRSDSYVCPTDPNTTRMPLASSYVLNYGDGVLAVGAPFNSRLPPYAMDAASKRGAFLRQKSLRFRDFLDGLSNTVMVSELKVSGDKVAKGVPGMALNPSLCKQAARDPKQSFWADGRNASWADGSLRSVGFQTILPPNSASATSDVGELEAVMSASSHHVGGVHVLFSDGAVVFVTNTIDAGDSSAPSVAVPKNGQRYAIPGSKSPYGLWGAIGTRASAETIKERIGDEFTDPPVEFSEEDRAKFLAIPVQDWNLADGTKIRGRLLQIASKTRVIIAPEEGEAWTIRFSEMDSRDAYRAIKQQFDKQAEKNRVLVKHLQEAVSMLEKRDFEGFLRDCISTNTSQRELDQLKQQLPSIRGMFIQLLDQTVMALRDGTAVPDFDRTGNAVEVNVDRGGAHFVFEDGRWRIRK